ncbi:MAG TPA: hypothetical protein VFK90_09145 [Anaeromyxobacter sp.]|nr:hypothetical protein [Anaeromyxobacter sp.]
MSDAFAFTRWPACTSALRLDRWLCGELGSEEDAALRAHLATCARCADAASTLGAARDEELPPLRALDVPARAVPRFVKPWRPALAAAGLAGALAAGLFLALRPGPAQAPGTALKGAGVGIGMWVQHGGDVRRVGEGEAIAVGDAVRFSVTTPVRAYVAVLSLDPAGHASVYFPVGPRAEAVGPAVDAPLPAGTRLDATVGEERVWALFCPAPIELEPVRARLERGGAAAALPEECGVTSWRFVKR